MKWHSWLNGVVLTTCLSMWGRQRKLWWTTGETLLTTPHWPSTARLWSDSAALNSWGCTLQRISPGSPTPCHFLRRYNSAYTFSACWKEQVSLHPSSPLSAGEPLRACWPATSLSGTGTVVQQTARPSSGQWQLQKIIGAPLPSILDIFLTQCSSKANDIVKDPTHPSYSLFQLLPSGRLYRSIKARSARWLLNSFFSPRLWEPWTQIPQSPSETP